MPKQNINAFEDLSVPKALAKFIIPSVVSQLTMLILNLTDAFFVGRTEDTYQISAMTITFPIAMMVGCIATIFGAGGNANIATALGNKDRDRAAKISVFSVYTTLGIIALMIITLLFVQTPLLSLLGADKNSIGYSKGYIFWVFFLGGLPLGFSQVMAQMFISEGETRIASMGISGSGVINFVLDPVFIFLFKMGVAGAGCATFIANIYSLIFFIAMYIKRRETTVLSLDIRKYTPKDHIASRVIAIGIPAGLNMLLLNCCDFVRNALLGSYGGQIELASWGVVQKIGNAFTQICVGISQGVRPLVAYNFTTRNMKRTRSIINGSFLIMGCYTVFCILLVNIIPKTLVSLFLPIEEAMPVAVSFLRRWTICIVAVGFLEVLNSIFQAMGRWQISAGNIIVGKISLMVTMLILVRQLGVIGIIISQPITDTTVAAVVLAIYFCLIRRDSINAADQNRSISS